ncbi:hypothetical protein [Streptomyces pseudovenezuelae]|uniref:Uncharacterized protein n=1 Tax=Streptomyces pseudovenezuelae TaxID=67350 RepID=A0ABT6LJB9_9ACTN|nr:hypothetical protein [Streptomyces pseudovenezuelae]MDH6216055.1 hypothetical protein [Streptomyces pseudovenezuelae]
MVVLQAVEVTETADIAPTPPPPPSTSTEGSRRLRPLALALLLATALLTAHQLRPAPYGDHLTLHERVEPQPAHRSAATPALGIHGPPSRRTTPTPASSTGVTRGTAVAL